MAESENPQPVQMVVQKSNKKGCLIAALVALGICVLGVGGCTLLGIFGIGKVAEEVSKSIDEQKEKKAQIVSDLELLDFDWKKDGLGSIMEASFVIKNNGDTDLKDIEIQCTHYAPSGTKIDSNTRTIYEIIKSGESRAFTEFNMGFIHSQADKSVATIKSASLAEVLSQE